MKLAGKTALVTGAARPIGRAIARTLAQQDVHLILPTYDWPESVQEMEEEFGQAGYSFLALPANLCSDKEVTQLVGTGRQRFGNLHILVNNIERGGMPVVHGSYDLPHNSGQWELELATTLKAKWLLFNHCLPPMQQAGEGAVVNISSVAAFTGRSGATAPFFSDGYSAANRAVSSFTETWARQAAPNIRVNELMLGMIDHRHGQGTRGWKAMSPGEREEAEKSCLLQRTGTPEEAAAAALFLLRDADYMTGSVLRLDGGLILGDRAVPPMPKGILDTE